MPKSNEVRKPPVQAVFRQHPQNVRGTCCWCGNPCEEKTPGRGWLKWWHAACEAEYYIIVRPDAARDAVKARDNGVCCDCGEDWSDRYSFRAGARCCHSIEGEEEARRAGWYRSTEVIWISLWHVDHKIPLWKVAHMPELQRLEYFKLGNLITRCHRCHERKTSREAGHRKKFRQQGAAKTEKPKARWATQKLKGRGFPPPGSRPMGRKK